MNEQDKLTELSNKLEEFKSTEKNSKTSGGKTFKDLSPLSQGMRIGLEFGSAVIIALIIGFYLDKWLSTSPLMLIIFLFLGFGSGFLNIYRTINDIETSIGTNRHNFIKSKSNKSEE